MSAAKFKYILKLIVSILTVVFVFYKIQNNTNTGDFTKVIRNLEPSEIILIMLVLFMVIPNWLLESIKWKILIEQIQPMDIKTSIHAVLTGISVSLLTPNRIGEIPGRTIFIEKQNKLKAMIVSGIGSACQAFTTLLFGLTGYLILYKYFNFSFFAGLNKGNIFLTSGIIVLIITSLLVMKNLYLSLYKKIKQFVSDIKKYPLSILLKIQALSIFRYIIFTLQFFLLFRIFEVELNLITGIPAISCTYLLLFLTPFLTLAEIGARGAAAIFCIGFFSTNIAGILLASFALWLINLIIPAIAGSILLTIKNN